MESISVLVVEDDPIIAADLGASLERMGYQVTETIAAGRDVLNAVMRGQPDLVLMDVQLEDDVDGIEVAHRLNQAMPTPIIFLTANSDEATFERARETVPAAFVAKPFDAVDLQRGIELAIRNFGRVEPEEEHESEAFVLPDRIFVRDSRRRLVKVGLEDVLYIQAQGNYCDIHLANDTHTVTCNLKNLLSRLDGNRFARVHRSYLINVQQMDMIGDVYIHLKGKKVPLGQSYRHSFLSRLNTF